MRSSALAGWLLAAAVSATAEPVPAVLVERILAVVSGRPVFLSEVTAVERVDGLEPADALERVIDETLLFHEAFRLPQAAVGADEEQAALPGQPMSDPALRRLAHRRAVVQKYVAFRFRPQVRIDDENVRKAYADEWEGREEEAPGFDSAAASVRERLLAEEIAARVAAWVKELRAATSIRYNAAD